MAERTDSKDEHSHTPENTTPYRDFLQRKIDAARCSVRNGTGRRNDEVEAEFGARRAGCSAPKLIA
ncbi:hypothetical protein D3C85_653050 [compost metagenome]